MWKLNIPKPPWYRAFEKGLEGKDGLVTAALIVIIVITILLILKGDRVQKLVWAAYLISP